MKPAEVFRLSEYILDELRARRMTLRDLAGRMGISAVDVWAKLQDADMARLPAIECLASALDMDPGYLHRLAKAGLQKGDEVQ